MSKAEKNIETHWDPLITLTGLMATTSSLHCKGFRALSVCVYKCKCSCLVPLKAIVHPVNG